MFDFEQIEKDSKRKFQMQDEIVEVAKQLHDQYAYPSIVGACFAHLTLEQTEKILDNFKNKLEVK